MKANNTIKVLIVIIIVLSMSLIGTTIKLMSKDTWKLNQDTPTTIDKNSGNIAEIVESTKDSEEKDNSIMEIPTIEEEKESNEEDLDLDKDKDKDKDTPKDTVSTEKDKPIKSENPNNKGQEDKDNNKDKKENNDNKGKNDKEDKKDKNDNNKNKDKNNKNDNNGNKDKDNKKDKDDKKSIIKSSYISKDEATKIGIKKVGNGAKLKKIEADLDDNPPKYELEITLGKYKYELEIHAITGAVIDFEKDEKDD